MRHRWPISSICCYYCRIFGVHCGPSGTPAGGCSDHQRDAHTWTTSSVQLRRRQSRTSATSSVHLVQLRRAHSHAYHHLTRLRPTLRFDVDLAPTNCKLLSDRQLFLTGIILELSYNLRCFVEICFRIQLLRLLDHWQTVSFWAAHTLLSLFLFFFFYFCGCCSCSWSQWCWTGKTRTSSGCRLKLPLLMNNGH